MTDKHKEEAVVKKIMLILVAAMSLGVVFSCDRYDDGRPSKDVRNEFKKMYPDAFDVEWEWDGTYWEVSFETGTRPDGVEHEAWYDKSGNWIQTSTDMALASVPQKIIAFLTADSNYGTASYADNEAKYIETPTGNFYRFTLSDGSRKFEVDVNINGEVKFVKYDF